MQSITTSQRIWNSSNSSSKTSTVSLEQTTLLMRRQASTLTSLWDNVLRVNSCCLQANAVSVKRESTFLILRILWLQHSVSHVRPLKLLVMAETQYILCQDIGEAPSIQTTLLSAETRLLVLAGMGLLTILWELVKLGTEAFFVQTVRKIIQLPVLHSLAASAQTWQATL